MTNRINYSKRLSKLYRLKTQCVTFMCLRRPIILSYNFKSGSISNVTTFLPYCSAIPTRLLSYTYLFNNLALFVPNIKES
jgi:hypothetical protein